MHVTLPWQKVHFIGIGGVGMAGLAHILLDFGVSVSGTDAQDSDYLRSLSLRSKDISTTFAPKMIDDCDLVVYSSAIAEDHPERLYAKSKNKPAIKRGELLAKVASNFPIVIGVAGSHGKTTTSSMIAHILQECGFNPGWMLGGCADGFCRNGGRGDGKILVTEVDESDGTQALMYCTHGVITNVEDDHSWFFGGIAGLEACFQTFAKQANKIWTWNTAHLHDLFNFHPQCTFLKEENISSNLELSIPGKVNRLNAALAINVVHDLGADIPQAYQAIKEFQGVQRRLTERYRSPNNHFIVIEDYAHHPTEIQAAINGVTEAHPNHQLIVLFQPHRYERIKQFSEAFSKELSRCQTAIIVSPFSAWAKTVDASVDFKKIFDNISTTHGFYSDDLKDIPNYLLQNNCINFSQPTVFLLVGAGDIIKATQPIIDCLKTAFMEYVINYLKENCCPCEFHNNQTWAELTTAGIGNGHPWIASVDNNEDLESLCQMVQEFNLSLKAIGNGSNLIGTDSASDTLWIKLEGEVFQKITFSYHDIIVGAAVPLHRLIREMIEQNCCPPEFASLAWIPAQMGGALHMNAGCHNVDISRLVQHFCGYLSDGTMWMQEQREIQWGYRQSKGLRDDMIITYLLLRRTPQTHQAEAQHCYETSFQERQTHQPSGRSAGCIFKNPTPQTSAGYLIDQCGLKGKHMGNCFVHSKHANFLMAQPGTSGLEFIKFMLFIQQEVFNQYHIVLEPEVEIIGNEERALINKQTLRLQSELKFLKD